LGGVGGHVFRKKCNRVSGKGKPIEIIGKKTTHRMSKFKGGRKKETAWGSGKIFPA